MGRKSFIASCLKLYFWQYDRPVIFILAKSRSSQSREPESKSHHVTPRAVPMLKRRLAWLVGLCTTADPLSVELCYIAWLQECTAPLSDRAAQYEAEKPIIHPFDQ
jgi:hypothetical protein